MLPRPWLLPADCGWGEVTGWAGTEEIVVVLPYRQTAGSSSLDLMERSSKKRVLALKFRGDLILVLISTRGLAKQDLSFNNSLITTGKVVTLICFL